MVGIQPEPIGFGGTEESLRRENFGVTERGTPGTSPFNRLSGEGWLRECGGDYSDAISKHIRVNLYVAEPSGAVCPGLDATLRRLGRLSRAPATKDLTCYGRAASSPRDFYRHYLAWHAAAVVFADVEAILNDAAAMSFRLTHNNPRGRQ